MLTIISVLLPCCGFASDPAVMPLPSTAKPLPLGSQLWYRIDPSGGQTFAALRHTQADSNWQPVRLATAAFGYTGATHWFTLALRNDGDAPRRLLLELAYPVLDYVELHIVYRHSNPAQADRHYFTGDRTPFASRPIAHRNFLFPLQLQTQESARLYLRVQTSSALQLPLRLWDEQAFWQADQLTLTLQSMYYGVMLVMVLYNGFLLLVVRDQSYFFYVLFVAAFALFQATLHGMSYQYFWPHAPWLNEKALMISLNVAIAAGIAFSTSLLALRTSHPRLHRLFLCLALIALASALVAPWLPYRVAIGCGLALAIIAAPLGLAAGIVRWRQSYPPARYYTIAWLLFLVGTVLFGLNKLGLLPRAPLTEHAMQIGSALEVTLLSFALASRINAIRRDRERAQRQRESAEAAAAAKSRFLTTMSHELRTPLNGLLGMLELLASTPLNTTQAKYARLAYTSSEQLHAIIADVLEFSQLESGTVPLADEVFNLAAFFDQIAAATRDQVRQRPLQTALKTTWDDWPEADKQALNVRGDPQRLGRAIACLVSNASKFTERGIITVRAELGRDFAGAAADVTEIELRCAVSDTGIGIAPEQQQRVFDAFAQADDSSTRRYGGSGLGLAIYQQLIAALGGQTGLTSQPNQGTTVWFTVPLKTAG